MRLSSPPSFATFSPVSAPYRRRVTRAAATRVLAIGALFATAALCPAPSHAAAPYWDSDSLSVEKRRFPGVSELLHDRLVRPSPAVLSAHADALGVKLRGAPKDVHLLDDLAWTQHQLGKHGAAVLIMNRSLSVTPDRFESHANLGSFHLHAGNLDEAIKNLAAALKLKPAAAAGPVAVAHSLATYWKGNCAKHATMPTMPVAHDMYTPDSAGMDPLVDLMLDGYQAVMKATIEPKAPWLDTLPQPIGFAAWLVKHQPKLLATGVAARALMGMLYRSDPNAPMVLEALADVMRYDAKPKSGSTQLAAAAYLRASLQMKNSDKRTAYVAKAGRALAGIRGATLNAHLQRLQAGLQQGAALQARIAKDSARWLAGKQDPSAQFAKTWYDAGSKALSEFYTFVVPACDDSEWGNLRKRAQVARPEMLKLTPRAAWQGYSLAGLALTHGAPLCHFRGQWLVPLRGPAAVGTRGVWLKVSGRDGSSVVRLLEPPTKP